MAHKAGYFLDSLALANFAVAFLEGVDEVGGSPYIVGILDTTLGACTLSATGTKGGVYDESVSLTLSSALSGIVAATFNASAAYTVATGLSDGGARSIPASATLSAVTHCSSETIATILASTLLSSTAQLSPGAALVAYAAASYSGNAQLTAIAGRALDGAISLEQVSGFSTAQMKSFAASVALDAQCAIDAAALAIFDVLLLMGASPEVASQASGTVNAALFLRALAALTFSPGPVPGGAINPALIRFIVEALTTPELMSVSMGLAVSGLIRVSMTSPVLTGASLESS